MFLWLKVREKASLLCFVLPRTCLACASPLSTARRRRMQIITSDLDPQRGGTGPVNSTTAEAAPPVVISFFCRTLAGVHTGLSAHGSFGLCLQPRASDIRVHPSLLTHVTREPLTKGHIPQNLEVLFPPLEVLTLSLGSRSPGFFPTFSDHRSHSLFPRGALPLCRVSPSCPRSPFSRQLSQGTQPAHSANGACKSSEHQVSPPFPILPKEWPQISKQSCLLSPERGLMPAMAFN